MFFETIRERYLQFGFWGVIKVVLRAFIYRVFSLRLTTIFQLKYDIDYKKHCQELIGSNLNVMDLSLSIF